MYIIQQLSSCWSATASPSEHISKHQFVSFSHHDFDTLAEFRTRDSVLEYQGFQFFESLKRPKRERERESEEREGEILAASQGTKAFST